MGSEDFHPQVERVAAALRPALAGRVATLAFGGLDKAGCHYHPSLADDLLLAGLIEGEIRRIAPGW
jgi:hypothetical protein